jgi:biotin operon repressor
MAIASDNKTSFILQYILDGYCLGSYKLDKLEFSANSMAKNANIDISMIPMILDKLETIELIKTYAETGQDFGIQELTYTILFHDDFKSRAKEYLGKENKAEAVQVTEKQPTILYIDTDGNFWHGDKNKFCYSMGATSNRFLTIKFLNDNEGFLPTRELAEKLGVTNVQNVMTEIKKIRNNIENFLKIDGEKIIESKKGSGYRIGKGFTILEQ